MLKCKITTKTPNWETKKMDSVTADYIVASTKSLNNIIESLQELGDTVSKVERSELYLDLSAMDKTLTEAIKVAFPKESEAVQKAIVSHCLKALDGAVCFKRPEVKRK